MSLNIPAKFTAPSSAKIINLKYLYVGIPDSGAHPYRRSGCLSPAPAITAIQR